MISEYLVISNLGEEMFSNHMSSLVRMLQGSPGLGGGRDNGSCIKWRRVKGGMHMNTPGEWCFSQSVSSKPIGLSKFVFRRSVLDDRLFILLLYLHRKSLMALVGDREVVQSNLATCILDRQSSFVTAAYNELKEDTFIRSLYSHLPQWRQLRKVPEHIVVAPDRKRRRAKRIRKVAIALLLAATAVALLLWQ